MESPTSEIMAQLKDTTSALHDAAERHPFQEAMVKGRLSREGFVRFLAQMYHLHGALELQLLRVQRRLPGAQVVKPYHFRTPLLGDDLRFFGSAPRRIVAYPAVSEFIHELDAAAERVEGAALGVLYVLEGSTNGSRFIARSVERALGLKPKTGTTSLDPHGPLQQERWNAFKSDMNSVSWCDAERNAVIDAALAMFRGFIRISDTLEEIEGREVRQVNPTLSGTLSPASFAQG